MRHWILGFIKKMIIKYKLKDIFQSSWLGMTLMVVGFEFFFSLYLSD